MARNYDSSRRKKAARQTRQAILDAAFRLHGENNLDLDDLAREADVSAATVRKHFPNRELLFEGCTAHGLTLAAMPDFEGLAAMEDPRQSLASVVEQTCAFYESLFGQVWVALRLEEESPVLASTLRRIEAVVDELAGIVLDAWPADANASDHRAVVTGMLGPLCYRGLRLNGGLSPAVIPVVVTRMLASVLEGSDGSIEEKTIDH